VIHWMDRKEAVLEKIRKASASLLPRYMAAFRKKDVFSHYRELFRNEERFRSLSLPTENIRYLCQTASESLDRKQLEMEDTAALLYLKHRLYGIPNRRKIKHVVIDEAQDFSVFQIYALKEAIGTRIFTIFGDLAQGIHSYRGITDWQEVLDHVFPEDRCQFLTLEKSYRTTVEIMELANQIIGLMNAPGILPARPVVRHGDKPLIRLFDDPEEPVDWIRNELERAKNSGLRSVAVIGRSLRECRKIEKLLKRRTDWSLQLLTGESTFDDVDLIIVPAHTAKGLEFDLAILLMLDEPYTRDELDLKLLYVAMTRPLHRLAIFARNGMFPLLEALDPAKYCKKCR
jgi:DNA helicase-2/ATP-dependent DNA helicase PcrA